MKAILRYRHSSEGLQFPQLRQIRQHHLHHPPQQISLQSEQTCFDGRDEAAVPILQITKQS